MGLNKLKYFNYVKNFFAENECKLLTTFENFTNKYDNNLSFKCKLCNICTKNSNKRVSIKYNIVVEYFKKYDCEILINNDNVELLTTINEYKG